MNGKEVQHRTEPGVLDVYDERDSYTSGVPTYNDSYRPVYEVPEWAVPVPVYVQGTSGIKTAIEKGWSLIMRWPRYLAIGFLIITVSPWRFTYIVGTIALLLILIVTR